MQQNCPPRPRRREALLLFWMITKVSRRLISPNGVYYSVVSCKHASLFCLPIKGQGTLTPYQPRFQCWDRETCSLSACLPFSSTPSVNLLLGDDLSARDWSRRQLIDAHRAGGTLGPCGVYRRKRIKERYAAVEAADGPASRSRQQLLEYLTRVRLTMTDSNQMADYKIAFFEAHRAPKE